MSPAIVPPTSGAPRTAAAVPLRVGPADAGRRVSLRHRLPEGGASDVVGVLESWDPATGRLQVARRDGSVTALTQEEVIGGLVVAPDWSAGDLQRIAQQGWPPRERTPLGPWELRWHDGVSGRANSARVGPAATIEVPALLAAAERFYRERGAVPLLQTPVPSVLESLPEARNWVVVRRTSMYTAPTSEVLARASASSPGHLAVTAAPAPDDAWVALLDEPAHLAAAVVGILTATPEVVFVSARNDHGDVVGVGRASIGAGEGRRAGTRWAGITSVATRADSRRLGVATAVMAELARWSHQRDADLTYLQVLSSNAPAIATYQALGFTPHHDYAYLALHDGEVAR